MVERSNTKLPELFIGRYFAEQVLGSGAVVPVRISMDPPVVPLGYELQETAETLLVEPAMLGEWDHLSTHYWRKLDRLGVEEIAAELAAISKRHDGLPLALCDYENLLTRGHRSPRVVFAVWWEMNTGREVLELTDKGERLHHTQLHKQSRYRPPKPPEEDRRWREDAVGRWPLTPQEVERWMQGRYWQNARTTRNRHSYTLAKWGNRRMFELVVLHIREHGYQQMFGGVEYTQYDAAGYFMWTMNADLPSTVLINRKRLPDSEGGEDVGAQVADQAAQPRLSDMDAMEEA
jgi:hypothetical protein